MPLFKGKSKKAFKKNVETEMHEGKKQDQALAIAYSMQRRSKGKKKMSEGGEVKELRAKIVDADPDDHPPAFGKIPLKQWKYGNRRTGTWGGPPPRGETRDEMRSMDLHTGKVKMHGPKGKLYAEGGEVYPDPRKMGPARPSEPSADEASNPGDFAQRAHKEFMKQNYAKGGCVGPMCSGCEDMKCYAHGGEVGLADMIKASRMEAEETPASLSPYDDMNAEMAGEKVYDQDLSKQPTDSNEHGDRLKDEDEHGKRLFHKIKKKRAQPGDRSKG